MILNSHQIVLSIKEIVARAIQSYQTEDVVDIGLRFDDSTLDKVPSKLGNLLKQVWVLIDEKDELYKEQFKGKALVSVFIQDKCGTVIYDSSQYNIDKNEDKVKREKNSRIRDFMNLPSQSRKNIIEITAEQITQTSTEELTKEKEKEKDGWSDLPDLGV